MSDEANGMRVDITCGEHGEMVIDYHDPLLAQQVVDYESVPEDTRGGQMRRLLCASAVGCFTGSVHMALEARGATVRACRGHGILRAAEGQPIGRLDIRVEVAIGEGDEETLVHVRKILRGGCLITGVLGRAIEVNHEIVQVEASVRARATS